MRLFDGFHWIAMAADSVVDSPPLSDWSTDILADRPRLILGRSGSNSLKQGQDDCQEAQ